MPSFAPYLRRYLTLHPAVDQRRLHRWLLPVAAARFSEDIPSERQRLVTFLSTRARSSAAAPASATAGRAPSAQRAGDKGGLGADHEWLCATILTVGYMISRGLAKAGGHHPHHQNCS